MKKNTKIIWQGDILVVTENKKDFLTEMRCFKYYCKKDIWELRWVEMTLQSLTNQSNNIGIFRRKYKAYKRRGSFIYVFA